MGGIRTIQACIVAAIAWPAGLAAAGEIVQEGSLSGAAGPPQTQEVMLDQFDTQDGLLQLDLVQLDLLTSTIGGGTSNGSGVPTDIDVTLTARYSLAGEQLAVTQAIIDATIPNTGSPSSFTLFNTDTEQVLIEDPADQAAWIGTGQVTLDVFTQFTLSEDPPGSTGFSAGGSVSYTVTYQFHIVGDLDDDGVVGTVDLLALLAAWGPCPAPCAADLDGDGVVGVLDLLLLLAHWG